MVKQKLKKGIKLKKRSWSKKEINFVLKLHKNGKGRLAITKEFNKKFAKRTTDSIRHCLDSYGKSDPTFVKKSPRVLLFDIETSPIISYTWGIWQQNVSLNQIKSDWHVLSWSAKWLGERKVLYADQRKEKNIEDDSKILKKLWELLDEADIVVTQNGVSFDSKKVNARFIINGFPPPSPYKHIDTKKMAKKHFGFTSNKLEYMSEKLCKIKKAKHEKFSGFDLWKECLKGNLQAWKEMEKYNKMDVLSLEELYIKLRPWGSDINFSTFENKLAEYVCNCGSRDFRKIGERRTKRKTIGKYKCNVCGSFHEEDL